MKRGRLRPAARDGRRQISGASRAVAAKTLNNIKTDTQHSASQPQR